MVEVPPEVVLTTKNTPSLVLGIIAIVVGVLAMLVGWVPFLGLVAVPIALVGCLLSAIGLVIALFKRLAGIGMPILGGVICVAAIVLPLVSTGGASAAITDSIGEVAQGMDAQREALQDEKARQEQEEESEKAAYIASSMELYEVTARYRESLLEGRVPGLLFKLRNRGERSLDKVEVTVYFKDSTGGIVAEEDFLPVLVTEYSLSGDNKPLKPGYVWQMEAGKFYAAKSVPSEWEEGSVDASITDIILRVAS